MVLHRVSVDRKDVLPGGVGGDPEIGFVPIDKLVIDDTYQRSIEKRGWANISRIANDFDWSKFSPLMVARLDDGRFAIVDGQHRAHAAAAFLAIALRSSAVVFSTRAFEPAKPLLRCLHLHLQALGVSEKPRPPLEVQMRRCCHGSVVVVDWRPVVQEGAL